MSERFAPLGAPSAGQRDPRRPRSVFTVGTEPDPRFSLANERTFLAWIRTSLALLAAGVALKALDLPIGYAYERAASLLLVLLAVCAPLQAWWGWAQTERAVRAGTPLPPALLSAPLGVGVAVACLLVLVGLAVS